jgi:ABC-type multidrug transport system fused ATPase/permease subunit
MKKIQTHEVRRILPFLKPYGWHFFGAFVLVLLTVLFDLSIPVISRQVIDRYINPSYVLIEAPQKVVEDIAPFSKLYVLSKSQDKSRVFIPQSDIQKIPGTLRRTLSDKNFLRKDNYYLNSISQETSDILSEYSFIGKAGEFFYIDKKDFVKVKSDHKAVLRKNDLNMVGYYAVVIIILVTLNFISAYGEVLLVTYAGGKVIHAIRMKLYDEVIHFPMSFYDREKAGVIVTRLTNDIANLEEFFYSVFINLFKDVFLISGIVGVLLFVDLSLGVVTLLFLPLVIGVTWFFKIKMKDAFLKVREALALVNTRLQESINGISIIRLFNRERLFYREFKDENHNYFKASAKQVYVNSIFTPVISLIRFFRAWSHYFSRSTKGITFNDLYRVSGCLYRLS